MNKNIFTYIKKIDSSITICLLLSFLMLFPKVMLISYTNNVLWGKFNFKESIAILSQDFLLAFFYYFYLRWAYNKNVRTTLIYALVISGLLLTFLMLDVRVRELWLRPINIELIQYTASNYKDLMSGSDIFFKSGAGYGMTYRRLVFAVGGVFTALFLALFYLQKTESKDAPRSSSSIKFNFKLIAASGIALLGLFFLIAKKDKVMYDTEVNVLVNSFIQPFKTSTNTNTDSSQFEQPLHTLSSSKNQSVILPKPFKNVIILILESIRFKEFTHMNDAKPANFHLPFIKKLASEGLFQKCYVSVPHTSKSQFAILSGRNPLADIEMRESMIGQVPSIVSLLKEVKGSNNHFITVQNLIFENTSGMLKALSFDHLVGQDELRSYGKVIESSSFGLFDDALLNYPYSTIKRDKPFILAFMTIGAHYPYDFPNKVHSDDNSYDAYLKAGEASDKSIALLFDKLEKNQLLEDTLVVIVSDHGESFGEHGTFIHNSSMYEEEITVPLIFWSKDNRLKNITLRKQVRQIDIAPTIAELSGINANKNYILQGVSLIKHDDIEPPIFISTFFANISQAIVQNDTKIMLNNADSKITNFDLQNDKAESNSQSINGKNYDKSMNRFAGYTNYHYRIFNN